LFDEAAVFDEAASAPWYSVDRKTAPVAAAI
jgi:hypothetical protein